MGLVELSVSDLDRSLAYWQDAIGLRLLSRENGTAELGADTPLVRFVEEPGARPAQGFTGLFHVALLVPDRPSLGRFLAHAGRERIPLTGLSDHVVSEAIYLRDPDYHGIEVYADRPREQWEGQVSQRMTTIPLDTDSLLAEAGDAGFDGLPDYHHHLGGNTWETRGASPAPEGTARLLRFTIVLPDDAEVQRVAERIGGTEVSDPSGNPLVLAAA
jgi:catechol 2,3-dioxygenase